MGTLRAWLLILSFTARGKTRPGRRGPSARECGGRFSGDGWPTRAGRCQRLLNTGKEAVPPLMPTPSLKG